MTRSEAKDRERLAISIAAGVVLHMILFVGLNLADLGSLKTVSSPKMVLVELAETTIMEKTTQPVEPKEQVEKVEEPVPVVKEEAAPKPEVKAPPAPEKSEPAPEPRQSVQISARPEQKAAQPKAQPKPAPRPAPVVKAQPKPVPAKVPTVAPVAEAPRLVADPSAAATPSRVPPATVGPKKAVQAPSLEKPDVTLPDWVTQGEESSELPSVAVSASGISENRENQDSGIDLSRLDMAIAESSSASTGTQPATVAGTPAVKAPPQPVSRRPNTINWKSPSEGRIIQHREEPRLPAWVEEQGLRLEVIVTLSVLPEGTVSTVDIEKTSGYTEIDSIIKDAVRRWRFLPVESTQTASGTLQWNIEPNVR